MINVPTTKMDITIRPPIIPTSIAGVFFFLFADTESFILMRSPLEKLPNPV
jgi:hypothetical protein